MMPRGRRHILIGALENQNPFSCQNLSNIEHAWARGNEGVEGRIRCVVMRLSAYGRDSSVNGIHLGAPRHHNGQQYVEGATLLR